LFLVNRLGKGAPVYCLAPMIFDRQSEHQPAYPGFLWCFLGDAARCSFPGNSGRL